MKLSDSLISQFVDIVKQDNNVQNGTTVYGTIKKYDGQDYVQIDGSELLTPILTTTYVSEGERVTVTIKDHQAIVTGNITSPATRQEDVDQSVGDKITEFDVVITEQLQAQDAKIERIEADNVEINGNLTAQNGKIENLETENLEIKNNLTAQNGKIENLETKKLDAETANLTFATIEELKATNVEVNKISGNFAEFGTTVTEKLEAQSANIKKLETDKLSAADADIKYANINFANIGIAAIEKLFADSGIIKDLVVDGQHITGELVGVTIKGDLIEAGTLVADKLVIKGSDGLYYKLNTNGTTIESEQTEYNSLNGSIITAKSITATKINVSDLVAFDATIGGFKITNSSIYSGTKNAVDAPSRGIYLDKNGQIGFGDTSNFVKFFQDTDGRWKLAITASAIKIGTSNTDIGSALDKIEDKVQKTTKSIDTYYAISNSATVAPSSGWSLNTPTWQDGKYIWSKTKTTYTDGSTKESNPVCITGANGSAGNGIKSVTNYYLATNVNSGVTESTSGWTTSVQTITASKKYLWNYEVITYTDNSTTKTTPLVIGAYGDKGQTGATGDTGATGNGIKSVVEYYLVSTKNSGVTSSTSGWSTSVPTLTAINKYLWNYEVINYTNGSSTKGEAKVIGVYGDKGQTGATGPAGIGIQTVDVEYYLSTSATSLAGGSWSTTAPTWVDGKYMWSRTKTSYSNGSTTTTDPVCITGSKGSTGTTGATGATGQGVESITEEYYLSTSKTTQTGGSWTTTPPTWSKGKYIWTRSKIVYKNPTSTVYTKPICDTAWEAVNDVDVKVEETKTQVAEIVMGLNTITQRVTSTETSITKVENSIKEATNKIKDDINNNFINVKADYVGRNILTTPLVVKNSSDKVYADSGCPNPPLGAVFNSLNHDTQLIKNREVSSNGTCWALIIAREFYMNTEDEETKNKLKDIALKVANFMYDNVSTGRFNSMNFKFIDTNYKYSSSNKAWRKSNYKEIYVTTIWLQVKALIFAYEMLNDEKYLNLAFEILDSLYNTHFYINNKVKSGELPSFLKWASFEYLACDNLSSSNRFSASTKQYANQMGYYIQQAIKEVIRVAGDGMRTTAKGDTYKPSDVLEGTKEYLRLAYENGISNTPLGLPYGYYHRVTNASGGYDYVLENWDFIDDTWGDTWYVGDVVTYIIFSYASLGLKDIARELIMNYYNLRVDVASDEWKNRFSLNELVFYDRLDFNTGTHLDSDNSISITYTALFLDIVKEIGMTEYIDACSYTLAKRQINDIKKPFIDGGFNWNIAEDYTSIEFKSFGEIMNSKYYKFLNVNSLSNIDSVSENLETSVGNVYDHVTNVQQEVINSYESALQIAKESINLSVSQMYARKDDVSSIKQSLSSKIDQTAKDISLTFNKTTDEVKNDLQGFREEITAYIRFDADGMELGKSGSKFKTRLTNEKLAFLQDNEEVAYVSNNKMNITDAEIKNQLTLGSFAFIPRSNGNLSLKWVK